MEQEILVLRTVFIMQKILILVLVFYSNFFAFSTQVSPSERFELRKVDNGYLLLNKQSGALAYCSTVQGKWVCNSVTGDSTAKTEPLQTPTVLAQKQLLISFSNSMAKFKRKFLKFILETKL